MFNSVLRYSSQVTIVLLIAGVSYEVSQITDRDVYLRKPIDMDPTPAELLITVDRQTYRESIFFPHGIKSDDRRAFYL